MNRLLFLIICVFLITLPCFSRLDETTEQIAHRYGAAIVSDSDPQLGLQYSLYKKNNILIILIFKDGISKGEIYRKIGDIAAWSSEDQMKILNANAENMTWSDGGIWGLMVRSDGKAVASIQGWISVYSCELLDYVKSKSSQRSGVNDI